MPGLWCDLRYGLRMLFKNPTFTSVAVMTLGLGIGAITAIFSVVHAVLLEPLPFPRPDELVQFYTQFPAQHFDKFWLSGPEYLDLRRDARSFRSVAAYYLDGAALVAKEEPVRVPVALATHTFAETVGIAPARGRWFADYEDLPGDPTVAVISDRLWTHAFKRDPDVVGRRALVDGMPLTIVGVMPAGFAFPRADTDMWLPARINPVVSPRGNHRWTVVGRLVSGTSLASARAELATLVGAWNDARAGHALGPSDHPMVVHALKDEVIGSVRSTLWLLQIAVGLVLLIATANVSNLLLARAEARGREIAVRNALGADRARLMRQFLSESLILGVLGGIVGLVMTIWGVDLTIAMLPDGAPRAGEIRIDVTVLAFGMVAALGTSLLVGLAPMLHTRVGELGAALKEGQRSAAPPRQRLRHALVVSEVALAVVLVIACGLVIKSFVRLQHVDPGFRPSGLVTGQIELTPKTYPRDDDVVAFFLRLEEALRVEPGVESTTLMSGLPPARRINASDAAFEGYAEAKDRPVANIDFWQFVGDDFFATLGMRLVRGRRLLPSDAADAPPVVVVNEALARKYFPGVDPVGRRLKVAPWRKDAPWQTIVGVVADVKQQGLDAPTGTEVFIPLRQARTFMGWTPRTLYAVVRGELDSTSGPAALAASIRGTVAKMDKSLPVAELRSMDRVMYDAVGKPRFMALLLGTFSALALVLAAIGVYGVMSYSVERRTRELGIRIALGARAAGVRRIVMAEGLRLAGIGIGLGMATAFAVNRGLATKIAALLYDVKPIDPPTFAGVAAVVLAVAALACFVPAWRATRVDPMIALR
ncbi:MAG TPA: ABC transporter permease, partial [Haliangiales bacterium]|nr:ABC transporter permease [Haliangiales bacterium]